MPGSTPGQVVSGGFDPTATSHPSAYAPQPIASQPFSNGPAGMPPGNVPGGPAGPGGGAVDPLAPAPAPAPKRRPLKALLITLAAVLIVGGGSAAAYFGVVVPNKPANVLKTAFLNTLQQTQSSTKGTVSASTGGVAYKLDFTSAEDAVAKNADLQLNLTVSGVTFPVEARLVSHNLYLKVGDLSSLAGLANAYAPSAGPTIQSLSSILSNKWVVVDSTLLDESSGLKCALNTNWTLSNADIKLLGTQYGKHAFATIQSTSSATIGGKSAEKFVLSIDNAKLNDFGNGVTNLSLIKALGKCTGSKATSTPSTNHGHTPLTIWVDKGTKRIVQIANTTGSTKSDNVVTTTVGLSYGKVSISTPSNAEPAIQVLTSLQSALSSSGIDLSQLLNSATSGSSLTQ